MRHTILKQCKQCGKDFESYESLNKKFCSVSCRCTFLNKSRRIEREKRECPTCHNLFEVTKFRTKYCSTKCSGIARRKPASEKPQYIPKPPKTKNCLVCGNEFTFIHHAKFCPACREGEKLKKARAYWHTEKYKEAHRRKAREWQKSNPLKTKAQYFAKKYPGQLNILYECPCSAPGKHRHHFDYTKPFDVIILCDSCHAAEHKRLRSLSAQAVAI